MKAISPMIAMVLLIAFVVAVGGLMSVWLTGLTGSQTESVSTGSEAISKCASTSVSVNEVRFDSTGASQHVNVTYSTSGTESLKNITISVTGGGATTSSHKYYNGSTEEFFAGLTNSVALDTTGGALIPPEVVSVTGICQGVQSLTATCEVGNDCMIAA